MAALGAPRAPRLPRSQLLLLPLLLAAALSLPRAAGAASAEAFDSVLGDTASCHRACQMTYPLHTYPKLMSLMPKMHLLFPLTLVRSFWSDMMDSAQSFITSSWTFYLQADDGKIVIFQSKPEIQYPAQGDRDHPAHEKNTPLKKKASNPQPAGSQTHRGYFEDGESDSFFKCLSLNSGWIVTITLVLSVLVLLWICCATVATAMEQYVPPEKLSIYGDLEFMNGQKLPKCPPSSLVAVRCQAEDREEAGPLPAKVNLTHSEI
ncbi:transmembrane protein 59 isoform X2 [Gracilinanus agilis]|uniref:transmembrane protein 59 isoform X2 n=1 Tax=Gracilinanus agilis TaxID=191870 RepID=UPI001CFD9DAC|nr:transmembrane protein 59 isoform X2 [Gracilinanus agilis]